MYRALLQYVYILTLKCQIQLWLLFVKLFVRLCKTLICQKAVLIRATFGQVLDGKVRHLAPKVLSHRVSTRKVAGPALRSESRFVQGCQIFLRMYNIPKRWKIPNDTLYTQRPKYITTGYKIPIPTFFIPRPSKIDPNLEIYPSGNPVFVRSGLRQIGMYVIKLNLKRCLSLHFSDAVTVFSRVLAFKMMNKFSASLSLYCAVYEQV
jgi:hypothetical protein